MENTEASTTTANAESAVLVVKDQTGEYYLLPQETLEQGRVAAEHKAEVERLIADQHDVQGNLFAVVHIVRTAAVIVAGAVTVIREGTKDEPTMTNAQYFTHLTGQPFPGRQ